MIDTKKTKIKLHDKKRKLKSQLPVTVQLAFKVEDANPMTAAAAAPAPRKRRNLQLMITLIGKRDGSKIEMIQI